MNEKEEESIWYFEEILVDQNDIEHWKIIEDLIKKQQNIIHRMARELTTPIHDEKWIIDFFTKLDERKVDKIIDVL